MLRSLQDLKGYRLRATDDELGDVRDFYFDDTVWTIRYVVADTTRWLPGRRVLIAASALGQLAGDQRAIPVALTREQVKGAPDADTERPIARQYEAALARHYSWPEWWGVGGPVVPPAPPELRRSSAPRAALTEHADPHLRSLSEVTGYTVTTASGERIGKVTDLLADTDGWIVRYFVVDVKEWRPGGEVLLAPHWVTRIDWAESSLITDLSVESLRSCPPYDASNLNRAYEERVHDHLGRERYWP